MSLCFREIILTVLLLWLRAAVSSSLVVCCAATCVGIASVVAMDYRFLLPLVPRRAAR